MKINLFVGLMLSVLFFNGLIGHTLNLNPSCNLPQYVNSLIDEQPILKSFNANEQIERLKQFILSTDNLKTLAYDNSILILVTEDKVKLSILDEKLTINEEIETVDLNNINITSVAVSETKRIAAFGNQENDLLLFDISKNRFKLIDSHLGDGKLASFIAFSSDGSKIAVLNYEDDTVSLFYLQDNILSKLVTLTTGKESGPLTAKFSQNGKRLGILCSNDRVINVYADLETGWTLTEASTVGQDEFLYFFDGDTLMVADKAMERTGNTNNVIIDSDDNSSNTIQNSAVSDVSEKNYMETASVTDSNYQAELKNSNFARDGNNLDPHLGERNKQKTYLSLMSKSKILTRTSRPLIKGKTIPNQKVKIYVDGTFLDEVIASKLGNFSFRVKNSLPNGSYKFNAMIESEHKNISSEFVNFKINKHYQLKSKSNSKKDIRH